MFMQSNMHNVERSTRELPRFSSATTIGSLSTNASFQSCKDDDEDGYNGDTSNIGAKDDFESNDILQNVNVLSDIDSITDVLSSMGIQSPKQVNILILPNNDNINYINILYKLKTAENFMNLFQFNNLGFYIASAKKFRNTYIELLINRSSRK